MLHNPYKVVQMFEEEIAHYTGAPYAVSMNSCTNALFLACKWHNVKDKEVILPKRTYLSPPQSVMQAGGKLVFEDYEWEGIYKLKPFPIYDAAKRLTSNMYIPGSMMCLSFHIKKHLSNDVVLKDVTDDYCVFGVFGPKSRLLMEKLSADDFSKENFKFATSKYIEIDGIKIYGESRSKVSVISFNIGEIHPYDIGSIIDPALLDGVFQSLATFDEADVLEGAFLGFSIDHIEYQGVLNGSCRAYVMIRIKTDDIIRGDIIIEGSNGAKVQLQNFAASNACEAWKHRVTLVLMPSLLNIFVAAIPAAVNGIFTIICL